MSIILHNRSLEAFTIRLAKSYPTDVTNGLAFRTKMRAAVFLRAMKLPPSELLAFRNRIAARTDSQAMMDAALGLTLLIRPVASISAPQSLSSTTINVDSTEGFLDSGTLALESTLQEQIHPFNQTITYTGKTPTSFTGCTGGHGAVNTGFPVKANQGFVSASQLPDFIEAFRRHAAVVVTGINYVSSKYAWTWIPPRRLPPAPSYILPPAPAIREIF